MSVAVLLQSHELPPSTLVATILAECAGLPKPVAMRFAGRGKWIVWENAPPDAARAVSDALTVAGAPSLVVPQQQVVPALVPRRVHVLKLDGPALGVQLRYTGLPHPVAWEDVLVVSAGALRTETTRKETTEMVVGRGIRVSDTRTIVDINRTVLADICARQPDGSILCIRLNCQEVNYAQTIGGSIHQGWREKFAVLLARVGMRSPRAMISPQTEALLAAGLVADECKLNPYFSDEEEFTLYNRWLTTRQCLPPG